MAYRHESDRQRNALSAKLRFKIQDIDGAGSAFPMALESTGTRPMSGLMEPMMDPLESNKEKGKAPMSMIPVPIPIQC